MRTCLFWKRFLIGFLFLVFLTGCATVVPQTPTSEPTATLAQPTSTFMPPTATPTRAPTFSIELTKKIVYANADEEPTYLDVHAPSEAGPWPVVIVAHGWSQNRFSFRPLANTIAAQGAVVYNIDVFYHVPLTISIERIACAVRFARSTAADYGGDPGRITLLGNSAGANSGVVAALAGDNFEGDCIATDASPLVDAFVGFEGGYDIATTVYPSQLDHSFLKDEDPELWNAVNPYSHIGLNPDLTVRLIHGDDLDTAWYHFSPDVSKDFYQALTEAGYNVELTIVDGDGHSALTSGSSDTFALTVEQVMEVARSSSQ